LLLAGLGLLLLLGLELVLSSELLDHHSYCRDGEQM